ncbi:MAG: ankyrin repeat domain-containing protein [Lentisphaeria bacterium]|nr:ankyrin repeat domain-containing protein [Lentisphaeria bacterium]
MKQNVKALFQAIEACDEKAVLSCLDQLFGKYGIRCVEELVNDEDDFQTPFHAAVKKANEDSMEGYAVLEALLKFPFGDDSILIRRDIHGIAPIGYAVDFEVSHLLCEYMPKDGDFDFAAVRNGDLETVKKELDRGRNINAVDRNGQTPLIIAARAIQNVRFTNDNSFAMFKLLLEHDPDINIKDYWGNTALAVLIGPLPGAYYSDWEDWFNPDIPAAAKLLLSRNAVYDLPGIDPNYYTTEFRKMLVRFMLHQEPEYSTFRKFMKKIAVFEK